MNKNQLALTSLTAALPGAFLAYLMVAAFLTGFEHMAMTLQALAGLTLLVSAGVALMPVAIIVFGPKVEKPKKAEEGEEADVAEAVVPEGPDELGDDEMQLADDVFSDDELEIDDDEVMVADDDVFDDADSGEFNDFNFDDEENA